MLGIFKLIRTLILAVIFILVGVALATRPGEAAHKAAFEKESGVGGSIASGVLVWATGGEWKYHNNWIYSTRTLTSGGKETTVSRGAFGMVWMVDSK